MANLQTSILVLWGSGASALGFYFWLRSRHLYDRRKASTLADSEISFPRMAETISEMQLPATILGTFEHRIFPRLRRLNDESTEARLWNRKIILFSIAIDFAVTLLAAAIGQFALPWLNLVIIALSAFQAALKGAHEHFQFQNTWITFGQSLSAAKSELSRFASGVDEYKGLSFVAAAQECISQIEAIFEANDQQVLSRHRKGKETDIENEQHSQLPVRVQPDSQTKPPAVSAPKRSIDSPRFSE